MSQHDRSARGCVPPQPNEAITWVNEPVTRGNASTLCVVFVIRNQVQECNDNSELSLNDNKQSPVCSSSGFGLIHLTL